MKRNFKLFVAVLVLAVMVFTLASCDMIGSVVDKFMPHEHEYSADWSSDETNHWHAALCDDAESADLAAHTFVEGVCSVCGYEKPVEDEKPACTHENMTPAETKAATCTEEGELTYTCSDCDYSFTEPTSKVDHTRENIKAVEPTCTETGLSKGEKCSVCDTVLKAQTEIPATGHDFADGLCKSCYAMDPNYAEAVTYYLGVQGMDPFAAGAKKDKDTETFVNFFTIYYSEKMKLDTSSKTFNDGFSASQRLNWQGGTDITYTVTEKDSEGNDVLGEDGKPIVLDIYVRNAIEFVVPEGYTASVTVWWVCGGDGRQLVIYDAAENVVDETTGESAKNALYLSTLEIGADGKYYLGNTGGSNYFFEVAVTLTPVSAKPSTPTLNGSGTYSEPYVLPTTGDYTTDAAGLVFYQYTVPADGFVTLSGNWEGGSVWLKLGTDINTADDNRGEGSSLKYFALKDTIVYIGVSDYNEVAEAIPFKVSFDEVTLGSIENVVGSWKGDFASMFGSATVIYSISEDGTGTASMDYGWGPNNYTIDKVVVVDNNVIIYLTNAYGSPETHNYVYAETEDGNKTLTGGVGSMTGELTPYDGEVGGNEPKPEVSYDTVVVIGANTLYFSADEVAADAATRKLNVTVAGNYKFASGNLFVDSVVDANGNTVAKNDDYSYTLAEGEYTLNFAMLSMFGVSADAACSLNVEEVTSGDDIGGAGDEGDDEDQTYTEPYDTLKDSLGGEYKFDNYNVWMMYNGFDAAYYANVYAYDAEGYPLYDLYFTYEVTENDDGSYTLTLTYVSRPDYEVGTEYVETVLGYEIVIGGQSGDPDACDHEWSGVEGTYVAPTCVENGSVHQMCDLCGEERDYVIEAADWYHNYIEDEASYKEPTCSESGYQKSVCSICGDVMEETLEGEHDYEYSCNYSVKTCSVCGYVTFGGELTNPNSEYLVWISDYGTPSFNIYTGDYSFDEYYSFSVTANEGNVYTLALVANDTDTLGLENAMVTITTAEGGITLSITLAGGTFTFTNIEEVVVDTTLDGTYAFNPEEGMSLVVKLENGMIYILEDTIGLMLPESFAYSYNPMTGVINTDGIGYFFISNGDLCYGRGWVLSPVV